MNFYRLIFLCLVLICVISVCGVKYNKTNHSPQQLFFTSLFFSQHFVIKTWTSFVFAFFLIQTARVTVCTNLMIYWGKIEFYCIIIINAIAATFSIVKNLQKLNGHLFHITKSTQCIYNTDKRSPFRLTTVGRSAILAWRTLTVKFHHLTGLYFMMLDVTCRVQDEAFFFYSSFLNSSNLTQRMAPEIKLNGNVVLQIVMACVHIRTCSQSHLGQVRPARIIHNGGEGKYRLQR